MITLDPADYEVNNRHVSHLFSAKPSWLYPIYIPSHKRAGSAPLLEMLKTASHNVRRRVHIVVRDTEVQEYEDAYPWATIVPQRQPYGIGPARALSLRDAEERRYQKIVMLDDDIWHVSLLERIQRPGKSDHTRRVSAGVSGIPEPHLLARSLAVACLLASRVFREYPTVAYGAARNALFSGDVDPEIGATINKGSFPACVMFIDLQRFKWRTCHKDYRNHGEDLSMCLDTMERGLDWFTLPGVAYDQNGTIETTIPLDPQDAVARTPDLENAEHAYPDMHPYLKASVRNKLGGVMRIGVNWPKWYKDTDSKPIDVPLSVIV
ncbi:glycosyltransferase [Microbacterium phage McGalleon]|uniref:Glycosyltransferase n=1 Tax=Microbacterium phage McGalleon TaxID=2590936 RepID=A0A516KQX9_9CAUD|nr:glycosyltransferase [Microbacterium phage McGalleon]QDP44101.1 glycosyltransferase [Microbacterium phage McGalleon]